jgi:hypothetical protein
MQSYSKPNPKGSGSNPGYIMLIFHKGEVNLTTEDFPKEKLYKTVSFRIDLHHAHKRCSEKVHLWTRDTFYLFVVVSWKSFYDYHKL